MLRPTMSLSLMPSRYLISARRLLPCAATMIFLPARMAGAMASFQAGSTRATVSLRHSVSGIWWRIIAAAPEQNLPVTVPGSGFGLVQPLQGAVVALIQTPVVLHRHIHQIHCVERGPQCADGALQDRGIGQIESETSFLEQAASLAGLGHTLFGQIDIHPASETVGQIPGRLAVAHENDFIHRAMRKN